MKRIKSSTPPSNYMNRTRQKSTEQLTEEKKAPTPVWFQQDENKKSTRTINNCHPEGDSVKNAQERLPVLSLHKKHWDHSDNHLEWEDPTIPCTWHCVLAAKYWLQYTQASLFSQQSHSSLHLTINIPKTNAAELKTLCGINTRSRFAGQNNRKIVSSEHTNKFQHNKTTLDALQWAQWNSSRSKLITKTPKASTPKQGNSWLCALNTFASIWEKKTCLLQSASWWFAQSESVDGHVQTPKPFTKKVAFQATDSQTPGFPTLPICIDRTTKKKKNHGWGRPQLHPDALMNIQTYQHAICTVPVSININATTQKGRRNGVSL